MRGVLEPDQNQKGTEVMRRISIKGMSPLLEQRALKPTAVRRQIEILRYNSTKATLVCDSGRQPNEQIAFSKR